MKPSNILNVKYMVINNHVFNMTLKKIWGQKFRGRNDQGQNILRTKVPA